MRVEHLLPSGLLGRRPVRILVVGAGGTGSAIVMGLPYLHQAMKAWGQAYGLEVTLMDGDTVYRGQHNKCAFNTFEGRRYGCRIVPVPIHQLHALVCPFRRFLAIAHKCSQLFALFQQMPRGGAANFSGDAHD